MKKLLISFLCLSFISTASFAGMKTIAIVKDGSITGPLSGVFQVEKTGRKIPFNGTQNTISLPINRTIDLVSNSMDRPTDCSELKITPSSTAIHFALVQAIMLVCGVH